MTQLVLIGLALAWIVVLAPDVARLFRPQRGPANSMERFRRQLDSLGRTAPAAAAMAQGPAQRTRKPPRVPGLGSPSHGKRDARPPAAMPTNAQQAAERRRDIGSLLVLCLAVALAGTLATRSVWAIGVSGVIAGLTLAFFVLVWRRRRQAPTAEVHYLPSRQSDAVDEAELPRRQVN